MSQTLTMDRPAPALAGRPWLAEYPPGVPAEVPLDTTTTLIDVLEGAFRRHAQRDACTCMGSTLTFAQLDALSHDLAAWLHNGQG